MGSGLIVSLVNYPLTLQGPTPLWMLLMDERYDQHVLMERVSM
jgi:hypothetical protein